MKIGNQEMTQGQLESIVAILVKTDPAKFNDLYAAALEDESKKRKLLQARENLQKQLDETNSCIEDIEKQARSLNGKKARLVQLRHKLEDTLQSIHKEWISTYSANGNASL